MLLGESQLLRTGQRPPGLTGTLLLAPLALWLLLFVLAPASLMVVYSFCQRDEFGDIAYAFTLENYHRIFSGITPRLLAISTLSALAGACGFAILIPHLLPHVGRLPSRAIAGALAGLATSLHFTDLTAQHALYLRILWRSVELAALTTLLCLLAGYPAAYFVGRADPKWRNRLLLAIMLPFWTSFLIRTYAWITILKDQGLLNATLESLHLVPTLFARTELLFTPAAVVIGMVYTYLPFMILPIYGSVEQLDPRLLDAASDLGATPARTFRDVILPLTAPGVWAGVLLTFVPAIGMFAITDLLGGSRVPMIGNVIQNQFGAARDLPFGAALGCTLLAIFTLVFLLLTRGAKRT